MKMTGEKKKGESEEVALGEPVGSDVQQGIGIENSTDDRASKTASKTKAPEAGASKTGIAGDTTEPEKIVEEESPKKSEVAAEKPSVPEKESPTQDRPKKPASRTFGYEEEEEWIPKTETGRKVKAGEITDIDEILKAGIPIMEKGIVDTLLPSLHEEVMDIRRVQRTLDSGRRMRFSIMVVVGDKNGHVGVGTAKGTEVGPTIKKAINRAKLNIIRVERACASWECGCGEPHTVPFKVTGKEGSVTVVLKPAPKGVGLVAGDNSKTMLEFAGIKDVWAFSKGHSRTIINQILATYAALKKLSAFKKPAAGKKKRG